MPRFVPKKYFNFNQMKPPWGYVDLGESKYQIIYEGETVGHVHKVGTRHMPEGFNWRGEVYHKDDLAHSQDGWGGSGALPCDLNGIVFGRAPTGGWRCIDRTRFECAYRVVKTYIQLKRRGEVVV